MGIRKTQSEPQSRIGKRGTGRGADGKAFHWNVIDEIRHHQTVSKILSLEKVEFDWGEVEIRLGYYIIRKEKNVGLGSVRAFHAP